MQCPKCGAKHSITTKYYGYTIVSNVCMLCGLSHTIGSSRESFDRQIQGTQWENPRNPKSSVHGLEA